MTTSVLVRLVLIVLCTAILIAWKTGLKDVFQKRKQEKLDLIAAEEKKKRLQREKLALKKQEEEAQRRAAKTSAILSLKSKGHRQAIAKVSGLDLHYLEAGEVNQGPSLLLLHGFGTRKEDWSDLLGLLGSAGCHVVAPDLPGFGLSTKKPELDYDLPSQIRRIKGFAEKLRLPPAHLVGSGIGGTIAAGWAFKDQEHVASVTLLEPFCLRVPYPTDLDETVKTGRNPLIPGTRDDLKTLQELLFVHPPEEDPQLADLRIRSLIEDRELHSRIWDRLRQDDRIGILDVILPEISLPVLYVQGGASRIVHPKTADLVRTISGNATVQTIADCGHLPAVERPDEVQKLLVPFLQRVESARRAAAQAAQAAQSAAEA